MKGNLSSHKYTKVGDKPDPMVKQDTKAGQTMETGGIAQSIIQDKITEAIDFRGNFRGYSRQNSREKLQE